MQKSVQDKTRDFVAHNPAVFFCLASGLGERNKYITQIPPHPALSPRERGWGEGRKRQHIRRLVFSSILFIYFAHFFIANKTNGYGYIARTLYYFYGLIDNLFHRGFISPCRWYFISNNDFHDS